MSAEEQTARVSERRLVLSIELPGWYVDDIPALLADYAEDFETESDCILNCLGEPGPVRLTTETHGEKASEVSTSWGLIRGAEIIDNPGVNDEDHLAEIGDRLLPDPSDAISDATETLLDAGVPVADVIEDLEWELDRLRKRTTEENPHA